MDMFLSLLWYLADLHMSVGFRICFSQLIPVDNFFSSTCVSTLLDQNYSTCLGVIRHSSFDLHDAVLHTQSSHVDFCLRASALARG